MARRSETLPSACRRNRKMTPRAAVGVIQRSALRAQRWTVGDRVARVDSRHGAIRIEAIERAGGLVRRHRHRAGPDAALPIGLRVIETVARQLGLGIHDSDDRERLERELGKAALEARDKAGRLSRSITQPIISGIVPARDRLVGAATGDCTLRARMSTQNIAFSRADHSGPSPRASLRSRAMTLTAASISDCRAAGPAVCAIR